MNSLKGIYSIAFYAVPMRNPASDIKHSWCIEIGHRLTRFIDLVAVSSGPNDT